MDSPAKLVAAAPALQERIDPCYDARTVPDAHLTELGDLITQPG